MAVFAENRPEYLLTQIACMSDSITVVPIPIRSADSVSVAHILDQTKAGSLCVSKHTFPMIIDMLEGDQLRNLKTIICFDSDLDLESRERGDSNPNVRLILWNELMEIAHNAKTPLKRNLPSQQTPLIICYTSGSTGMPKGTINTHLNMICCPISG